MPDSGRTLQESHTGPVDDALAAPAHGRHARLCRLDLWLNPVFDEMIGAVPGVSLSVLPARGDDARTLAGLKTAHAYHVSAAKDELPRQWFVTAELIAQCPELVCVSSGGAGYDTVDVAACTAAGIAVVNQAGGNAASVAEHTYALLLAVQRRVVESHNRLRHDAGFSREDLMGHELHGGVIGLVGIGQIGTRVARIAQGFGLRVIAHDPLLDADTIRSRGAEPVALDELLAPSSATFRTRARARCAARWRAARSPSAPST